MQTRFLLLFLLFLVPTLATRAQDADRASSIVEHSDGLHGYIGFSHEKLPPQSAYSAGMGFYAAVWPLVDEPLAHFQIGLPSSWILPDNSDVSASDGGTLVVRQAQKVTAPCSR